MLESLKINNFAIIEYQQSVFYTGLTVITGETGAGKSLLIGALALLQGQRADTSHIKSDAQQAIIEGVFNIEANTKAQDWLRQQKLFSRDVSESDAKRCCIKRVIDQSGHSKIYINGCVCTLQLLRCLGKHLVQIHSQHQHQVLLDKDSHIDYLDHFAGLSVLAEKVKQSYCAWQLADKELVQAQQEYEKAQQRQDLLSYQLEELAQVDLTEATIDCAYQTHKELAQAESLEQLCVQLMDLFDAKNTEVGALLPLFNASLQKMSQLEQSRPAFKEAYDLLCEAFILCQESFSLIRKSQEDIEYDPSRLQALDEYLSTLNRLARKHRVHPRQLPELLSKLEREQSRLKTKHLSLEQLLAVRDNAYKQFIALAADLSHKRQLKQEAFEHKVTGYMRLLGMPEAVCKVSLHSASVERSSISVHGVDRLELMLSSHAKLAPLPLRKCASGGELSRLSLALFMLTQEEGGSTLVLDEIDTGLGGQVAELLGKHLVELSKKQQVICVTHLPQIAAKGQVHLTVKKESSIQGALCSRVSQLLDAESRILELARMFGLAQLPPPLLREVCEQWV